MNSISNNLRYAGVVLVAVLFSWLSHELAHWLAYTVLGYEAVMTFNTVYIKSGGHRAEWHMVLVSAAGPLLTILQAVAVYFWLRKKGWNPNVYPFLLIPLYTRLLAGVMNFINLNDEGRISHFLGIGDYTLSIVVSAFLGLLVYKASKQHKPGWRYQVWTIVLIMIFSSILILGDQAWGGVLLPL